MACLGINNECRPAPAFAAHLVLCMRSSNHFRVRSKVCGVFALLLGCILDELQPGQLGV